MSTKFEYNTFVLGAHPSVAAKYKKVLDDLKDANSPTFGKDKNHIQMLESVKKDLEKNNKTEDLQFQDEHAEIQYWINRLSKQASIELVSGGKVSSDTMFRISCLPTVDLVECVRKTTILTSQLNSLVQQAEKSVQDTDVVPLERMND